MHNDYINAGWTLTHPAVTRLGTWPAAAVGHNRDLKIFPQADDVPR